MPFAPSKPCTFPGCGALVQSGTRCAEHAVSRSRFSTADRFRGHAAARGYDARWQAFRPLWLARYPLCAGVFIVAPSRWTQPLAEEFHRLRELDRQAGRLLLHEGGLAWDFLSGNPIYAWAFWGVGEAGTVIDHIKPHRGNPELFWAEWNLQTVTDRAHNKKTPREE